MSYRMLAGSLFLIGYASVVSVAMAASGWELLDQDIDAWESELMLQKIQRADESIDLELERTGNVFPMISEPHSASGGAAGKERAARTKGFLSVLIGGRSTVLRDVPRAAWFAPYVRSLAEKQIMTGYRDASGRLLGEFRPASPVTLEEVAKIAVISAKIGAQTCGNARNPSASDSWSLPYVACAERKGWSVFNDAGVDVRRTSKRAEVIVTLLQALNVPFTSARGTGFADVNASTQFAAAIERATLDGIISGDDTRVAKKFFRPEDPMNRAELAKVITLALQYYK